MQRIVIFANGTLPDLEAARSLLRPDDFILAADGGTHHVLALGLSPQLVVGDLDSLDGATLHDLEAAGTRLEHYPIDKNETDLGLALRHALELEPGSLLIVGALGGRLDQMLGNLSLLTRAELAGLEVRVDDGLEEAFFVWAPLPEGDATQAHIQGRAGEVVSLLPWGAAVDGIITEGLRWPLRAERLYPDHTRGLSNEMLGDLATIRIASGLLLVVHRRQPPGLSLKSKS
jgi:thiamine pyrophosphokinase